MIYMPINAAVCALLHPDKRHGVDKRHGPPLKLIFVLCRERLRALKVFRGGMHIGRDAGEGVPQALLDERYRKVRDVDPG